MKRLLFVALLLFCSPAYGAVINAIIPSGAAISNAVNVTPYIHSGQPQPIALLMPSSWTTANLTFLISIDGGSTFTELYDGNGNEYVVNAAASEYILLDPAVFGYMNVFEIRSANTASPPSTSVNQSAARTIEVVALPIN